MSMGKHGDDPGSANIHMRIAVRQFRCRSGEGGSLFEENPRLRIERLGFPDGRREIGFMESERKRQLTSHLRQLLIELSREQPLPG
ncbi:hypothetical protein AXW67_02730 [Bradyrhizobium neotropicale]|uniref:Uncharacterized protein n=1 Tax=Bradyrhizobium neotropicale TaxID=1497615 RepID=A0A176ZDW4_9BRAD|nr:hypothetical protein AXW67_02730 [Bradyrhizobium neotropicale]